MLKIEIHIPHPVSTLVTILSVVGVALWALSGDENVSAATDGVGGSNVVAQVIVQESEEEMRRLRLRQALLEKHEEVLRYQIRKLEEDRRLLGVNMSPERTDQFRESVRELVELLQDKNRYEERMLETLTEMWEAEERAYALAENIQEGSPIEIAWPVAPIYGISAGFRGEEYKKIFGFEHNAIDIPALQETAVLAAQDGIVEEVVDNGLGYSWVSIRHDGFVTVYGHISASLVEPGDSVFQGDPIAESGGMPGTKGAGSLTTGPHVHFELITSEGNVDPEKYLPQNLFE